MRFQAISDQKNSTQIFKMSCGRCLVNLTYTLENVYFDINVITFRHLELEIALAIPASNE